MTKEEKITIAYQVIKAQNRIEVERIISEVKQYLGISDIFIDGLNNILNVIEYDVKKGYERQAISNAYKLISDLEEIAMLVD